MEILMDRQPIRQCRLERDLDALARRGVDLDHWMVKHFRAASRGGEFDHLDDFIDPTKACIDLGANTGHYTLKLAARCRNVLAIEPLQRLAHLGRLLPEGCTWVTCAAGEAEATAELNVPIVDGNEVHGMSSLRDVAEFGYPESTGEQVAVRPLDDIVAEHLPETEIGLIKIDVEGWELPALRGAAGLLERHRPTLQVEIAPSAMPETARAIEAMGYRGLFYFDHVAADISTYDRAIHAAPENDWDPAHPERFRPELHVNNFFFLPRAN
jgi:FkbM family methyltransferase